MTLEQLRIFLAVAERQHVTRAAEVLGLTQSAVSHKVKRLEASLDCELLTRRPGAALFTEAGEDLLVPVWRNGEMLVRHDFDTVRARSEGRG